MRKTLWIAGSVLLAAAIAAPKVLPLTHSGDKPGVAKPAGDAAGSAKSGDGGDKKKSAGKDKAEGGAPIRVSSVRVQPTRFVETLASTGTLIAEESVELQAETSGKVVSIGFTEGSRVRKGALLVKLNDGELRATRERARHRLALAQARDQRIGPLVERGLVTREEYDAIVAEVQVQKSEIALADAQIEQTEIRAPFDGVVGLRYVSEGAFVSAATRVATLQRLDKLKIDFSVPEKYASRVRVGSTVLFSVAGGTGRHEGRIYALDPRIESSTRTVVIRAICPNPDGRLLPGAFASVELALNQIDDALLVPSVAVVPGLDEKNVYVVHEGKAERRAVETGTRTATTVHILAGLQAGDVVITSGLQQMKPGQAVSLEAAEGRAPGSGAALAGTGTGTGTGGIAGSAP